MEMLFKDTAVKYLENSDTFRPFAPFPRAENRSAWEGLPDSLKKQLISMGERYLNYKYPSLRASDFMAFRRTGNRTDYEDLYFSRRYALNSLVMAECAEYRGRFLDDIVNGIFALCEESAWQLPAHNSYERGAAQEPLPDAARPVLDLFACETGCQLACVNYLLGAGLDRISPFISKRIRRELDRRILTPYLTEHFWWMGAPDETLCNWTPWCTQNVLLTAFLRGADGDALRTAEKDVMRTAEKDVMRTAEKDVMRTAEKDVMRTAEKDVMRTAEKDVMRTAEKDALRTVFSKAAESLDFFLKDYGEDGCCDEGAQYYRHAGLCLDGAADVLNRVSGGAFDEIIKRDKIKNIAAYIFNVHVNDKYYFNFADCSPVAGRAGAREYLFGKHTAQPELMQFAAEDFRAAKDACFSDESNLLNLYYRLETCFCYEEIMRFDTSLPLVRRDIFYPSVGLFVARSASFDLAVKAGDNDDSHNHNDTGSVTLYKNGSPVLADIGVESYTQKTFSPRRYEIWTMQSGYHNLPTIDGTDQHDGPSYRAEQVRTLMTAERSSISMELAAAYPLRDRRLSYVRSVIIDRERDRVLLRDTLKAPGGLPEVILNFITYEKPEIFADKAEGSIQIGSASALFKGARHLVTETLPVTDKRLKTAWDHDLYRVRLLMTENVFELTVR